MHNLPDQSQPEAVRSSTVGWHLVAVFASVFVGFVFALLAMAALFIWASFAWAVYFMIAVFVSGGVALRELGKMCKAFGEKERYDQIVDESDTTHLTPNHPYVT